MRSRGTFPAVLLSAVLCGCGAEIAARRGSPPAPVPNPNVLRVMTPFLSAVNLDDEPGPEAIRLRVFFKRLDGSRDEHRMVTVSGSLKFLMFDGKIAGGDLDAAEPRHAWRFSPQQVAAHLVPTMYGWGYEFVLRWERDAPRGSKVTIVAVFQGPSGRTLHSAPMHITIGPT